MRLVAVALLVVAAHAGVLMGLRSSPMPSGRGEAVVATPLTVRAVAWAHPEAAAAPPAQPRLEPEARFAPLAKALQPNKTAMAGRPPAPRTPVPPPLQAEWPAPPTPRVGEDAHDTAAAATAMLLREALRDLPSYAVTLPPSQQLHFKVTRGGASGRGVLDWARSEGRYLASLKLDGESLPKIEWTSQGETLPGAGVAPQRMVTHRRGRPTDAANFMPEQHKATFSGARFEQPFVRGGQDRITWMLQLAGVFNARSPEATRPGEQVLLYVVGPRGSAELWNFKVLGPEMLGTDAGEVPSLRLVREAERLYDMRYDIWLDPARHHLPVKWRQQQHGTTALPLEWERVTD